MRSRNLQRLVVAIFIILMVDADSSGLWPLAPKPAAAWVALGPEIDRPALQKRFEELKEVETPVIISKLEEIRQGLQKATDCVGDLAPKDTAYVRRIALCSGRHSSLMWRDLGPLIWVLMERGVVEAVPLLEDLSQTPASAWTNDLTGIPNRAELANAWLELGRPDLRRAEGISFAREAIVADKRPSLEHSAARLVLFREKRERGWSPELRALLDDSDWRVRLRALTLISIRGPYEPWEQRRVIDALMDPEARVREIARARLGNPHGDDSWVDVWLASLDRDDLTEFGRESIHRALARRGLEAQRTDDGWIAQELEDDEADEDDENDEDDESSE